MYIYIQINMQQPRPYYYPSLRAGLAWHTTVHHIHFLPILPFVVVYSRGKRALLAFNKCLYARRAGNLYGKKVNIPWIVLKHVRYCMYTCTTQGTIVRESVEKRSSTKISISILPSSQGNSNLKWYLYE